MTVFRSNKQIYVQLVDDLAGKTLAAASSRGMEAAPKKELAAKVGQEIAKKAQEAGITSVVFDRNGYLYHGRVKELADAARNGGADPAVRSVCADAVGKYAAALYRPRDFRRRSDEYLFGAAVYAVHSRFAGRSGDHRRRQPFPRVLQYLSAFIRSYPYLHHDRRI